MSRQSKNRKHSAASKSSKGHMAGKHFGEGVTRSHFPHMQPAPCWLKRSGKKGWYNTKGVIRRANEEA